MIYGKTHTLPHMSFDDILDPLLGLISPNFFAKRKDASARRFAKKSPFNFTNSLPQSAQLNLPNL